MKFIFLWFIPTLHSLKTLKPITLFNDKSLEQSEGDPRFWHIEDKAITASAPSLSMGNPVTTSKPQGAPTPSKSR